MKTIPYILAGLLCLAAAAPCAAERLQNQPPPPEQQRQTREPQTREPQAKELDKQIDNLASQIISGLNVRRTHKIAVVEFTSLEGKTSDLGKYLAEELTTRLFRTGRFQIVERQLLQKMMDEQKLSASGLVDAGTASKFGRVLGVDALTTGTLADLRTSVRINARLISVETGSVSAAASVSIPMTGEVRTLLNKADAPAPADRNRFDGTWNVTLVCPRHTDGALGYGYQFTGDVKDGVFHGEYTPPHGSVPFTFDGEINPDGTSLITVKGYSGDPRFAAFQVKRKTPVTFHLDTRFEGNRGTGKRIEVRECTASFVKR